MSCRSRITVIGGTGYAGSNIVREAHARGHDITSFSRSEPETRLDGVTYRRGSAFDTAAVADAVAGADGGSNRSSQHWCLRTTVARPSLRLAF
ncbi:NAD(P)H-binding protein [Cryobacterium sp. GrIS_2_6]|uniref:NAD(P)H-binding protein n=1 Tax=Cryobacterium sp. GrIS_2_6 TaxID=3162785 RepID=UPI002E0ED989